MTATPESYARDADVMLAAAHAWRERYPDARLRFAPLGLPRGVFVAAALDRAMIRRVGASPQTRALLHAMDKATGHRGTVEMANACIARVFGLRDALTVHPEN